MSLLGVDIGTSGVRAAAYDRGGRELASRARSYALHREGAAVELDAAEVVAAVEQVVAIVAGDTRADPVEALSFSVLGEAYVALNGSSSVSRAPVSMDPRGGTLADVVREDVGDEAFTAITGQPLHPMFAGFKMSAGLLGEARDARYRCFGDLLAERWTGIAAIDMSMAARTGVYDVGARAWSERLLDALHRAGGRRIDETALPRVVGSFDPIGRMGDDVADRLGLPHGVVVVAGMHDQAAAYLGAGGRIGRASSYSFGSSDCLTLGTRLRPQWSRPTGFASYPIADDHWITLAGTAAGGWALVWLAELMGANESELGPLLDDLADEPPALLVLPYLVGSGTLDNDPAALGTVHGLRLGTTRPQLVRAFLEASGFELGKIVDALDVAGIAPGEIRAVGSGAHNPRALAARAEAAGVPLVPTPGHASARGAALAAGIGIGIFSGPDALPEPQTRAAATPTSAHRDWYDAQRSLYSGLYDATRSLDRALRAGPHAVRAATSRSET
ncbi:L-fuculokinase [Herbiconiux sp. L3-i23]|uniref:FGGY-family carbohydrate kinase n=1 Tax=Herbiconiux sp. L3-i23 TaxID=2905871 RepID=UPI00204D583F|nr:FGGY family carbohydrate kinase [Herbiconiux sp. L3-i23]BDI22108.1 xylulokinase [Herbiconiux sp. L3-i23]